MQITAAMVKELRARTDAPMMECKKALTEASGDLAKAEDILRIRLGNKAGKAAARTTAEGVVGIRVTPEADRGAIIEVNCETDFVARNEDFLAFVDELAGLVLERQPADVAALAALPMRDGTVESVRVALVGKIGENLSIRRFERLEAQGRLASYVHGGAKIGVLVDLVGGDDTLGRDLAMHIAATRPRAVSVDGVDAAEVEHERSIARAKADESGKPANIIEKMVEGAVQKYLKEVTLLGQPFVKDDKQTVQALLASRSASVARFALYVVGEGIEKRQDDFAAEVAAQAAAAQR